MDKKQQELIFKLTIFEQQMRQLQEQLQAVEQAIIEASSLNLGLEDLKGPKEKEALALIGKGIFAEAKITSEDLIVDIGAKNFVKKSIPDTQKIIKEQLKKLEEVRQEIEEKLEEINSEITTIVRDVQGEGK